MRNIKHKIACYCTLSILLFATSCDNYNDHNMVDDQIYVLNSGEVTIDVNEIDLNNYDLYVIKSGIGQEKAELELTVSESLFDEYTLENPSYRMLPTQLYSFESNRTAISKGDYKSHFHIEFDVEGILAQMEDDITYVLPCVVNANIAAKPEKMRTLIILNVLNTYIEFPQTGLLPAVEVTPASADVTDVTVKIGTNFTNQWDISYALDVPAELVEAYNLANGTSYALLPEAASSFDSSEWTIEGGSNEGEFTVHIIRDGFQEDGMYLLGNYLLPVRINSVSQFSINPESSVVLIPVTFTLDLFDRSDWEVIEFSSEEPVGDTYAACVLDDNLDTFWHSAWSAWTAPLPHYLIIDMKRGYMVSEVIVWSRLWWSDMKTAVIALSLDNESYTEVGQMDFGTGDSYTNEQVLSIPETKARYLKITVTESNREPSAGIAEIYVRGALEQ